MCGSKITHKVREKASGSQTLPNGSIVLQNLPEEAQTRAFFARHCCIHYKTQESREIRGGVATNAKHFANSAKTLSGRKRRTGNGKRKTALSVRIVTGNHGFCPNGGGKRKTENGKYRKIHPSRPNFGISAPFQPYSAISPPSQPFHVHFNHLSPTSAPP